jgi:hypothetical protein
MKISDLQHCKQLGFQELHLVGGNNVPPTPKVTMPKIPNIVVPTPSVAVAVDVKNLVDIYVKADSRGADYKYTVVNLVGVAAAVSLGKQAIAGLTFKLP